MKKTTTPSLPSIRNITRYTKKLFSYLGFTAGIFFATPLLDATTYTVSNTNDTGADSFRSALTTAGAGDTINFDLSGTQTITMGSNYPRININPLGINPNPLTINGQSTVTISGNSLYQPLFIRSGVVIISNLNFENCAAIGGEGGACSGPAVLSGDESQDLPGGGAGGGGLGAGGTLFVDSNAIVQLNNVNINSSSAKGGNGGIYNELNEGPSPTATPFSGGGGAGLFFEGGAGSTLINPSNGRGGGGGGGFTTAGSSAGNGDEGGVGGDAGGNGGNGTGYQGATAPTPGVNGQTYGGGGGGGGAIYPGSGASGGSAGFGGGGGGGSGGSPGGKGGNGGYGGGGGGGGGQNTEGKSTSIFGGGDGGGTAGSAAGGGGGGAALGGAIFVNAGGVLTFTGGNIANTNANSVVGGMGSATDDIGPDNQGANGIASGQDLFFAGGSTVTINPAASSTITLQQVTSDNFSPSTFNVGGLGTLDLSGGGTFTGTVSVANGSTLELDDSLTATPITVDGTLYQTGGNVTEVIVNADGYFNNAQTGATVNTAQVSGSMEISGTTTTLNVLSGGTASTQGGAINTATVSGQLSIDPYGFAGTLVLNSGGTAYNSGGIGTAEVSGNLTIESGGSVNILTVNSAGTATASNSGQVTTADVSGNFTVNGGALVGDLNVETGGTTTDSGIITTATVSGNFIINSGGTVTTVTVNPGGTTTNSGTITTADVSGDLTVNTGATVNTLTVNSGGTTTNSGNIPTADVSGDLAVNSTGQVQTLTVESGGTTTNSGTITTATVSGDLAVNSTGQVQTLTVESGGTTTSSGTITTATVSGDLTVNTGGTVNTLTVNSGGTTTNSGTITTAIDNGTMVVNSGGAVTTLTVASGANLTNSGNITTATSSGTFTNEASGVIGTLTMNSNAINAGSIGTANVNSGTVLTDTGSIGTAIVNGTLNISGTASNVTVNSGGLVFTSGMLGTVTIMNGGLLSGTGTITSLTNDGSLILGSNGMGLINAGTFTQSPNGVLYDQIGPNGTTGSIKVSGNANLAGGLQVSLLPGIYLPGISYPVITTGGQVNGTFSTFSSGSLALVITYLPNAVLLSVNELQFVGVSPAALKGNALQVLNNLVTADYANDPCLAKAVSSLPFTSNTALTKVLNELEPTIYQGLSLTTFENLVTFQQILSGRSALFGQFPSQMKESYYEKVCSDTETAEFWVAPFGLFIEQNKLGALRRYKANTYGAAIGLDNQFLPNMLGGMSLGFSQTNVNWSANTGSSSFQTGYLGLYTGGAFGCVDGFYFDASLLASFERYHAERNIQFFHKKAKTKHTGFGFDGHLGIGFLHKDCLMWSEPYATVDYSFVHQNKFKEKGASCLDLHVRNNNTNLLRYEFGVQFSKPMEYCSLTVLPAAYVSYVRRQVLDGDKLRANFKHQSQTFNVHGTRVGLDKIAGGASLNFLIEDGNLLSIAYDAEYSKKKENSQSIIFTFESMY